MVTEKEAQRQKFRKLVKYQSSSQFKERDNLPSAYREDNEEVIKRKRRGGGAIM